ncbi:MAG: small GTP-binding domain protein [Candidatus Lokiarchaeum sp. GC14_75]|nr:MAG: small GTP-binding domain protein [Candidatus Lokiarchaeum sp. GC14_75]
MEKSDYTFKIVIFGDSQTGKTTLSHRFLTNLFKEDIQMTLGVDFLLKAIKINGKNIKLQIWDFAGEERFRFLFPSYIRGANGAIFMYDITNYGSLAHVDDWYEVIENEIDEDVPILFVGGKTDLIHLKEISTRKAMEVAKSKNAEGFIECSSRTGENVQKIFDLLTKLILKRSNDQLV